MARRKFTMYSMSFLDIMSCGFGAIVLLFMIINHQVRVRSDAVNSEKLAVVTELELSLSSGRKYLVEARNILSEQTQELVKTEGRAREVIETLNISEEELATFENETLALTEHINQLKSDLESTDEELRRLKAVVAEDVGGEIEPQFIGPNDRQLVTGLRLSGDRLMIFVDASASMLAATMVNVLRRRNMSDAQKKVSRKWQRAVKATKWIIDELPDDTRFQVVLFNAEAQVLLPETAGDWLDPSDNKVVNALFEALDDAVPEGGSSLYKAFSVMSQFKRKPDNVFLVTDGLPTMGKNKPTRKTVSSSQRANHFHEARRLLPDRAPVSVILFPMEGDPAAPPLFWGLTAQTNGSTLSPASDWP